MQSTTAFAVGLLVLLAGGFLAAASGAAAAPGTARDGEEGLRLALVGSFTILALLVLLRRRHLL